MLQGKFGLLVPKDDFCISLTADLINTEILYHFPKVHEAGEGEVGTVLFVCCTVEILLAKGSLLAVFILLLHPYYLYTLYYFYVHSTASHYTAFLSPLWILNNMEEKIPILETRGGRSYEHLNVCTYVVIQIGEPVTVQSSPVWMSVSGVLFSCLHKD